MRLWIRLAAAMALVSVVPLLLVGLISVDTWSAGVVRRSEAEQEVQAASRAEFIASWMHDQVQALEGWMRVPFRLEGSPENQEGLLRAVYVAVPSVVAVALVDEDGVPVVPPVFLRAASSKPEDPTYGRTPATAARAAELVRRLPLTAALLDGVAVGDPYLPEGASVSSVPVAVHRQGLVLGAEVSLQVLRDLYTDGAGESRVVAVLDAAGRPVVGANNPLVSPDLLSLLGTHARVSYAQGDLEVSGAVAPVAGTDWTVLVVEPTAAVREPAERLQRQTLRMLFVAIGLALLLGLLLSRSVSGPVDRLRAAALAVAEGRYGQTAGIRRGDEIGELADAFDHMSSRLQQNRAEIEVQQQKIEAFNRELQLRVEERTRDLEAAQEQLVKSGQLAAVAEVGAGLAHELNNPLAGILGMAQLLSARSSERPEVSSTAQQIEREALRCREVVGAMLRVASGEVDPTRQPVVDLGDVLREVLDLVGGSFRQRGVAVSLVTPREAHPVRLDPVHGSRIFAQILNTLRAGLAPGASVEVRLSRKAGEVTVLLDPSEAVVARDDWRASGMGLWVAQHLLHQLGGRLEEPKGPSSRAYRVVLPEAQS